MISTNKIDIANILLNLFIGWVISEILCIILSLYFCWPLEQMAAVGAVYMVLIASFTLVPLNILILCVMFWLRINRIIIQNKWYVIGETILYFGLICSPDYICLCSPIIIILLGGLQTLILRQRKRINKLSVDESDSNP